MAEPRVIYTEDGAAAPQMSAGLAADPAAVVAASVRAERRLRRRPIRGVDLHGEGLFTVDESPLRLTFTLRDADRTAVVETVRLLPGHAGWTRPGGAGGTAGS